MVELGAFLIYNENMRFRKYRPVWNIRSRKGCLALYGKLRPTFVYSYIIGWDYTGNAPRFRIDTMKHIKFYKDTYFGLFKAHLRL